MMVFNMASISNSRWPKVWGWVRRHQWQLLLLFVCVLIPLYIFGNLADEVIEKEPFFFDEPILRFFYSLSMPFLDQVMIFFSRIGERYGLIPLNIAIFAALLWQRRRSDAIFWLLAVGGAAAINFAAKLAFGRVRPDLWISLAPETSFSFPSGHAMGTMALVAALLVLLWPTRWRWWVLILGGLFVLLVSISRVYLGVHYPSDILAGWMASLAWVFGISSILYRQLSKPTAQSEPV